MPTVAIHCWSVIKARHCMKDSNFWTPHLIDQTRSKAIVVNLLSCLRSSSPTSTSTDRIGIPNYFQTTFGEGGLGVDFECNKTRRLSCCRPTSFRDQRKYLCEITDKRPLKVSQRRGVWVATSQFTLFQRPL